MEFVTSGVVVAQASGEDVEELGISDPLVHVLGVADPRQAARLQQHLTAARVSVAPVGDFDSIAAGQIRVWFI
jgi:hypothetical protein